MKKLFFIMGIISGSLLANAQNPNDLSINTSEPNLGNMGDIRLIPANDYPGPGNLELGLRSTASLFGSDGNFGSGMGGQFRVRLGQRINTEWFADILTSNLSNAGRRTDGHIGWSVMFYPFDISAYNSPPLFTPYILAGHCFDYTKIQAFSNTLQNLEAESAKRWSSAVQMGLGTNINLTPRADFSLSAQYMLHLGKDVHAHVSDDTGIPSLVIEETTGSDIEGHLLITLSFNYKIADLW